MIHFDCQPEPEHFDTTVRQPGQAWLALNPEKEPKDFWSSIRGNLAEAFGNLCAYAAIEIPAGTVDHYLSKTKHPQIAYEWTNYRYCLSSINSSKRTADNAVLDPFEVVDGWFEVTIPGFLLRPTEDIPQDLMSKALFTIERLKLNRDQFIKYRRRWVNKYNEGKITMEGLRESAPLLAKAVELYLAAETRVN